jgi:uncharacterized repeat protein (TIGR03803 family)
MSNCSGLATHRQIACSILSVAMSCSFFLSAFRVDAQLTILHSFGDGTVPNDGANPQAGLIQAANGNFYGTTANTALNPFGSGVIFQMTPAGAVTTLYTFTGLNLSASALLLYNDDLVGITFNGGNDINPYGTPGFGTIFQTSLSGQTEFLHKFSGGSGPSYPSASLVLGPNGDLYGTTSAVLQSAATVFTFNAIKKKLTVVHNFPSNLPSFYLQSPLLLGQDGNFYGITPNGTIFMMTPGGEVKNLYTFSGYTVGVGPLVQDAAGNFYGTTDYNGTYNEGTVFKMTPQYVVSILYSFGESPDSNQDPNTVVVGPDGNLYGTTTYGGTKNAGVIYQLAPDGSTYTILHHFYDGSVANDGYGPVAPLVVGADKNLYGTTAGGGSANLGVIFKIVP